MSTNKEVYPHEENQVATPYLQRIYGGQMAPGKRIKVIATVENVDNATEFYIALSRTETLAPATAIRFRVKFAGERARTIEINNMREGKWNEPPEYVVNSGCYRELPIRKGRSFSITISATKRVYKVDVDDASFHDVGLHLDMSEVRFLHVCGVADTVRVDKIITDTM